MLLSLLKPWWISYEPSFGDSVRTRDQIDERSVRVSNQPGCVGGVVVLYEWDDDAFMFDA